MRCQEVRWGPLAGVQRFHSLESKCNICWGKGLSVCKKGPYVVSVNIRQEKKVCGLGTVLLVPWLGFEESLMFLLLRFTHI